MESEGVLREGLGSDSCDPIKLKNYHNRISDRFEWVRRKKAETSGRFLQKKSNYFV